MPHLINLIFVFRIAYSRYRMEIRIHAVRDRTAEQVDLIRPCHNNQQFRLFHPGSGERRHGRTVSLHRHNIVAFLAYLKNLRLRVNQGNVVPLRNQLPRQRRAYFAVPRYYDLH